MNNLKESIDKINDFINDTIKRLNKFRENMKIYYRIYNNIINNFDYQNINFQTIKNLKTIDDAENIIKDINEINDNNYNYKINNIYNKMINNEINIIYNINKKQKKNKIRIFGKDFVKNNKDKCKIIIDEKESELMEEYNIKNYHNNKLEIKLINIDEITDMSHMFNECLSLLN